MNDETEPKAPLGILVVEDNPRHIADARKFFQSREEKGAVQATYVETYAAVQAELDTGRYDCVISDVFFPLDTQDEAGQIMRIKEILCLDEFVNSYLRAHARQEAKSAAEQWVSERIHPPPAGVLVIETANEQDLPSILITDEYHHGMFIEPVTQWCRRNRMHDPIDARFRHDEYEWDSSSNTPSMYDKNWKHAYETVVMMLLAQSPLLRELMVLGEMADDVSIWYPGRKRLQEKLSATPEIAPLKPYLEKYDLL